MFSLQLYDYRPDAFKLIDEKSVLVHAYGGPRFNVKIVMGYNVSYREN